MDYEKFKSFVDFFSNLDSPTSFTNFIINALIIVIILTLKEIGDAKKGNRQINLVDVLMETSIGIVVGSLILLIFKGNGVVVFSSIVGAFFGSFIYNKFLTKAEGSTAPSPNPININIVNGEQTPDPERDLTGDRINLEHLDNPDVNNIIDILILYNYISPNHRKKLYEESIFMIDPDDEVRKLLQMTILTADELHEAYAIKNLIKLRGRLVTKEEAVKWIINQQNRQSTGQNGGASNGAV